MSVVSFQPAEGLTDALIEEQAFRQEFEDAVRAEIKHAAGVAFKTGREKTVFLNAHREIEK